MKKSNQWAGGIMVNLSDGSIGVFSDFQEAQAVAGHLLGRPSFFEEVQFNWNSGEPIIRRDDGTTLRVVDLSFSTSAIQPAEES